MNEKTENSSINKRLPDGQSMLGDAIILFVITLVAALLLGLVNEVTKGPIERSKSKAKEDAFKKVFEAAARIDTEDALIKDKLASSGQLLNDAGLSKVSIDDAGYAMDSTGGLLGFVIMVSAYDAYDGDLVVIMGFDVGRRITRIEFLTITETAGFGLHANDAEYKDQYNGIRADRQLEHGTDSGVDSGIGPDIDQDVDSSVDPGTVSIDAISGATITSKAVLKAVNAGIVFANDLYDSFGSK